MHKKNFELKTSSEKPLGRRMRRQKDMKLYLMENGCENMD